VQSQAQRNGKANSVTLASVSGLDSDLLSQSTSVPTPGSDTFGNTGSNSLEVRWLPSMPLLNKRNTPPVAGIGILYSEELDQIFHVFETGNLNQSINSCCRQQASALAQDPSCRISWYESTDVTEINQLLLTLRAVSVEKAGNGANETFAKAG